jgi:Amt family ammonium transporter
MGFNAGSGLAADGLAGSAFMVTHIAAATAALTWAILDWIVGKKPTVVGISTGAVAGLVAITPAAGFVDISGALLIGLLVSLICFFMVAIVKPKLGYDDSLDAFGVHGIGGIIGALATGLFASPAIQAAIVVGLWQLESVRHTSNLCRCNNSIFGIMTYILFKITDKLVGIRVAIKTKQLV